MKTLTDIEVALQIAEAEKKDALRWVEAHTFELNYHSERLTTAIKTIEKLKAKLKRCSRLKT